MDFLNICRVCLKCGDENNEGCLYDLFQRCDEPSPLKMMQACAKILIFQNDQLPSQICDDCLKNLKIAYRFKKKCEASYTFLVKTIIDNTLINSPQINNRMNEIKLQCEDVSLVPSDKLIKNLDEIPIENINTDVKTETIPKYGLVDISDECDSFEGVEEIFLNNKDDLICDNNQVLKTDVENIQEIPHTLQSKQQEIEKCKDTQNKIKITIDIKKYGNFIVENRDDVDLDPDYLSALYRIYKHRCTHCPRIYAVATFFKKHVNRHLGIKPYFCELCQKNFADERSHLKYHKQRKEKNSFKCQFCIRAYNSASSLRTHMKIHTGEIKWFHCNQCPKKFTQLNKLNSHLIVHTNDRNFICQYCSKTFRFNRNLNSHIKAVHVKVRSHKCDSCPKSFTTPYELRLHKRRHLGIKDYQCKFCSSSFVCTGELQCHVLSVHTKNKKYACQYCGTMFSRTTHRNTHEKSKRCLYNMTKNNKNVLDSNLVAAVEAGRLLDDFIPHRGRQKKSENVPSTRTETEISV